MCEWQPHLDKSERNPASQVGYGKCCKGTRVTQCWSKLYIVHGDVSFKSSCTTMDIEEVCLAWHDLVIRVSSASVMPCLETFKIFILLKVLGMSVHLCVTISSLKRSAKYYDWGGRVRQCGTGVRNKISQLVHLYIFSDYWSLSSVISVVFFQGLYVALLYTSAWFYL